MPSSSSHIKTYIATFFLGMAAYSFGLSVARADVAPGPSLHGEYSLLGALHGTGGNGSRTLIRPGEFLSNELKLRLDDSLPSDWNFHGDLHARQTPDPQIDKRKDVHLLGWTTELYNPFIHFTGGDFFGDFSQYTLQQSLTGAQAVVKTDRMELKGVAGYSQRADEGKHFMRYVFGGRSEFVLIKEYGSTKDLRLGGNFVDVEDAHQSIDNKTGVPDISSRVGSVNSHVLLWDKTDIDAEAAGSWTDDDTSPGTDVNRKTGNALRVNSTTRFSRAAKLRLGGEWVGANFETVSGSAVPDRVDLNGRFDYKWNQDLNSEMAYRVNWDKLEHSTLNKRTVTQSPRAALNWSPNASENWLLKDYNARLFWNMRSRVSDDDPSGQTDFLSNEYGIEHEFKVQNVNFDSGWTTRVESDDLHKENNNTDSNAYVGLRMREKITENTLATPSLRYQFDYDNLPKLEGRDLSQTVTAGLNLDIGDRIRFEQRYSVDVASRLAHDADTSRFNAHLGLDYKIPVKEDVTLKIMYEHNGFNHSSGDQSFSEENFQTQLLWIF